MQVTTEARKVVVHAAGGHDKLKVEPQSVPAPGPGQIRVDVKAIGVNYADCIMRMGLYASAKEYVGWPITPGFEVSGVVESVGEGGRDLTPGTRVFAVTRFGGYATHVAVPRHQVFPIPEHFDLFEAAAFPSVFLSAYW